MLEARRKLRPAPANQSVPPRCKAPCRTMLASLETRPHSASGAFDVCPSPGWGMVIAIQSFCFRPESSYKYLVVDPGPF
jgi:hypothetical protein